MGKYLIEISRDAQKDLQQLKKSGRKTDIEKVSLFFREIEIHPRTGTGQPEQLKYQDGEVWSRRINKKDRFVYRIYENKLIVLIVSALGHYDDK